MLYEVIIASLIHQLFINFSTDDVLHGSDNSLLLIWLKFMGLNSELVGDREGGDETFGPLILSIQHVFARKL